MDIVMGTKDWSKCFEIPTNQWKHADFLPHNIFCVIAGSTGSGKTNFMIDLLLEPNKLNYCDVHIYSKTLFQPGYEYLKKYFKKSEKGIFYKTGQNIKLAHFYDADEDVVDPNSLDMNKKHIIVFDDVMNEKQKIIKDYFTRGRHGNVDVFYLVQSIHQIAKHSIRQNANMFVLFHQDIHTLKHFHGANCSGDMDFKEFQAFCDSAWEKKHGYVVINIWDEPHCGRYWLNYTDIYTPKKYLKNIK